MRLEEARVTAKEGLFLVKVDIRWKIRGGGGRRITKRFKLLDSRFAEKMLAESSAKSIRTSRFPGHCSLYVITQAHTPPLPTRCCTYFIPANPPPPAPLASQLLSSPPPPSDFRLSRATRAYTVNEMKKYLLAKGDPRPALLRKHHSNPGELCWNSKEGRVAWL